MEFRQLTQEDIDYVREHSISQPKLAATNEADNNFALVHEGITLGMGGIRMLTDTTAWAWVEMTEDAKKHLATGYRVIKDWMNKLCEIHKIKRLQAYVQADFPEGISMAKHLGFHVESMMGKFIGDKHAYMFVRFFGDEE